MRLRSWLLRVLFESILIVFSILLALGLNEWQNDNEKQRLVDRSILAFEREIQQNEAILADLVPYHAGLRDVLHKRAEGVEPGTVAEYRDIIQGFKPAALFSSAWGTAVATGSLANMDYELVSALSLTYGIQLRFDEVYGNGSNDLLRPGIVTKESLPATLYAAGRYMDDVTAAEGELQAVYTQALQTIKAHK